jgi:hypothetical protein
VCVRKERERERWRETKRVTERGRDKETWIKFIHKFGQQDAASGAGVDAIIWR